MRVLCLIVLVAGLGACANEQVYTAIQEHQRLECGKLPPAQFDDCMRGYDTSYRDYEAQRKEASGSSDSK